jgi:exonuclease III
MTLNAEFLWDGVEPEEGTADFPWKGSEVEARDHMQDVADIIIAANPDIISLCEVENELSLATLNDGFLGGMGYEPFFIKGTDTSTGQDMALLTRVDPVGLVIERDERRGESGGETKGLSKHYIARFEIDDLSFAMIGIHLRAFPLHSGLIHTRQAQADAIRSIALDLIDEGNDVIVLGDFNDYDGGADALDHIDSTPVTTVLAMIRELDPADDGDDLTSAASFVGKALRFTGHHDANDNEGVDPPDELTMIDHVLMSPALAVLVGTVDFPHDHDPIAGPDHFPIVVHFELGEVPVEGGQPRIARLLPNPDGDEDVNEEATITNIGTEAVSLVGWMLKDKAGRTWSLDEIGTLDAGESSIIMRNNRPMALNNSGDVVRLIDPEGTVVQSVTYGRVEENEEVFAPL